MAVAHFRSALRARALTLLGCASLTACGTVTGFATTAGDPSPNGGAPTSGGHGGAAGSGASGASGRAAFDDSNALPVALTLTANAPRGFTPSAVAPYFLQTKHGAKRLSVDRGDSDEGLQAVPARGAAFYFTPAGDGTYFIRAAQSDPGKKLALLEAAGAQPLVQANVTGDAARFRLEPEGDGYFRIVNQLTGLCLEAAHAAAVESVPVSASRCHDGGAQRWAVRCDKKGHAGWMSQLPVMQPEWVYDWWYVPPKALSPRTEYVPMISGKKAATADAFAKVQAQADAGTAAHLLGYNEPEQASQGDTTVAEGLTLWPKLEATGLRLGSPAGVHADVPWVLEFMAGADERGYRVDFVTIHWYGGPDVNGFIGHLKKMHELHNKPLWITEFSCADWSATADVPNRYTRAEVVTFMRAVLPRLDALDYVERYSWFSFKADNAVGAISALYELDGSLTELGRIYRDHPHAP
jgi:hypothetical protein